MGSPALTTRWWWLYWFAVAVGVVEKETHTSIANAGEVIVYREGKCTIPIDISVSRNLIRPQSTL